MIQHLLIWLNWHRHAALALVIAYTAAVTLGHDATQELAFWAQDKLNRERWNALNLYVALAGVIGLATWCGFSLRRCPRPGVVAFVGSVTTLCAVVCFNTLLMVNVEMIHFPQYAILSLLVYPLTRRYGETVLIVAMLGAIDEGYQYLVLHGNWGTYYDLNDVTLNLLGAGFGVILIYLARGTRIGGIDAAAYTVRQWILSPAMVILMVVVLVGVLGALTGLITILPNEEAWLVLCRCGPPGPFWIQTDWGKRYHVLEPHEAIALWIPLFALYFVLDCVGRRHGAAARTSFVNA